MLNNHPAPNNKVLDGVAATPIIHSYTYKLHIVYCIGLAGFDPVNAGIGPDPFAPPQDTGHYLPREGTPTFLLPQKCQKILDP